MEFNSLPQVETAKSKPTLCRMIRSDYRHYSGAFTSDDVKPGGTLFSRVWTASLRIGFWVLFSYRLRHAMERRGKLSRKLSEVIGFWTKLMTGCYISAHCSIGRNFELPHPVGIVIGDGVVIKDGVSLYQGVTLGSSSIGRNAYPTLENNVTVFANAIIIGDVTLGANATIGAGAIVLKSVPPGATAAGNPARILG
jgi:serine O-acetyltransferase